MLFRLLCHGPRCRKKREMAELMSFDSCCGADGEAAYSSLGNQYFKIPQRNPCLLYVSRANSVDHLEELEHFILQSMPERSMAFSGLVTVHRDQLGE